MKILKKFWFKQETPITKYLEDELSDYNFAGTVEFVNLPVFAYEINRHFVVDYSENVNNKDNVKVIINDQIIDLHSLTINSVGVSRIKLSRNYDLQKFFDDHANAHTIVFFLSANGNSIYHEGYTIRAYIDEKK